VKSSNDLNEKSLAQAWTDLQEHAAAGLPLEADAYRLAFADPEFLLRRAKRAASDFSWKC